MDWVPLRSISDMMSINYKGFGKSKRGIVLWHTACIVLIWVVWQERNARNAENLWDFIHFLASLWAFCSMVLRAFPLMCDNQIGQQCVAKNDCSLFLPFSFLFLYSCCLVFFGGRIPHPSFVLINSINIFLCYCLSKKNVNQINELININNIMFVSLQVLQSSMVRLH